MKTLSPIMRECESRIRAHGGKITRYPGGYWCVENAQGETMSPTYAKTTVVALVRRGILEFTKREGDYREVEAKVRV